VLPLALVHPPQGVKLLAWCQEREDCAFHMMAGIDST
jgi:predicted DNA-binding transcriptional regulator YafY